MPSVDGQRGRSRAEAGPWEAVAGCAEIGAVQACPFEV